ncbi:unnamed protein product [Ilex paraguariensis]|uniref:Uncharacterized protein n=2 Tax=Ilex paraguariensis TaxID=185542 RepID=A0ABC8RT58_9AQUA
MVGKARGKILKSVSTLWMDRDTYICFQKMKNDAMLAAREWYDNAELEKSLEDSLYCCDIDNERKIQTDEVYGDIARIFTDDKLISVQEEGNMILHHESKGGSVNIRIGSGSDCVAGMTWN